MAGELASAVALQSQPYNRPQSTGVSEAALDNAFNGRRRADEERKRKEDADRQKRLDDIAKNTVFSTKYKNAYHNRIAQQAQTEALEEVYSAFMSGEENLNVVGFNAVRKLQELDKELSVSDESVHSSAALYDKDPSKFGWLGIGGDVKGNKAANVWQALNDPKNDAFIDETSNQFSNPAVSFVKKVVGGKEITLPYILIGAAEEKDPMSVIKEEVNNPDNATHRNPKTEMYYLGDNSKMVTNWNIPEMDAVKLSAKSYADPTVVNGAYRRHFQKLQSEAQAKGQSFTPQDYMSLPAEIKAAYVKSESGQLAETVHKRIGRQEEIAFNPDAPKAEKPSVYNVAPRTAYIAAQDKSSGKPMGYNIIAYNPQAGKNVSEVNVDLPAGHYEIVSGKVNKISNPNSLSAKPKGPAWLDGRLGFMYTNDSETYFNPLDQGSYQMWLQHTDVPEEDVLKEIQQLGSGNKAITDANRAWMEKMGLQKTTPSGSAKAPSAAPASGTINLQDLPVGAKIEVRNGKNYYNGKEIKM